MPQLSYSRTRDILALKLITLKPSINLTHNLTLALTLAVALIMVADRTQALGIGNEAPAYL